MRIGRFINWIKRMLGYTDPFDTYTINSYGTLNILQILKSDNKVKAIMCITSDKCYKSNNSTKGFVEEDSLGDISYFTLNTQNLCDWGARYVK